MQPTGLPWQLLLTGFGTALIAVSWSYDGWNCVNLVAGEIRRPERNLPRALILGTGGITLLYLLVNLAYFRTLPLSELAGVVRVAEKAATATTGQTGAVLVSLAVLLSTLGSANGSILTGPRLYYAMARDGLFFRGAARLHPRFRTPGRAIVLQAVWSCLLALSGTFEQLFTFVMFVAIIFWVAAAASVITLRRKLPDLPRPYRVWGYPWVPILFIAASLGILFNTLWEKPVESLAGLLCTLAGLPVYLFWRRQAARNQAI
jgi:APA family basic amino acid/polyamine antiporter